MLLVELGYPLAEGLLVLGRLQLGSLGRDFGLLSERRLELLILGGYLLDQFFYDVVVLADGDHAYLNLAAVIMNFCTDRPLYF